MPIDETTMGGAERAFPPTTWRMLSRIRDSDAGEQQEGLAELCSRYWKPIYLFLRTARAKSNEDAKDLTQAFFVWLCEGESLRRYAPQKGGFRKYLRVLLRGFASNEDVAANRLKRGGGVRVFGLQDGSGEPIDLPDPRSSDPEREFDRAWIEQLSQRALDRVRARFSASGRDLSLRIYDEYELAVGAERPTYGGIAARLGLKEGDVRNHLFAVREALRAEVRSELAELTADDDELEEEWKTLSSGRGTEGS